MMSRKHKIGTLAAVVAFGLAALLLFRPGTPPTEAAGQPAEPKITTGDEGAIRKANADYVAAMVAGDLDTIMTFWAPDADYIDEAGKMTRGKDEIAALFRKALADMKGSKITGKIHSLKFLRPEICLEDGSIEFTAPAGTKDTSRFAAVWTRVGDKWLLSNVRDLPAEVTDLPSLASAQLKDLEWLIGEWEDDEAKKDVTMTARWDTNKAFLLLHYSVKREGNDNLEVTVRVGWDGASGRIRSWTFDSQGGFSEAFWLKDGKRWLLGSTGVLPDGGIGEATYIYEFKDANAFVWRATEREIDGQPLADSEVKYVRKAAK